MHRQRHRLAAIAATCALLLSGSAVAASPVKSLPSLTPAPKVPAGITLSAVPALPVISDKTGAKADGDLIPKPTKPARTVQATRLPAIGKAANPGAKQAASGSADMTKSSGGNAGAGNTPHAGASLKANARPVAPRQVPVAPLAILPRRAVEPPKLTHLKKRLAGIDAKREFEQAGFGPELGPRVGAVDPATGNPLVLSRPRAATDPLTGKGLGGRRNTAAQDPLTGRSLLGGDDGASDDGGPGADDAREAGMKGRGMAMSDDPEEENTTDDTKVYYDITYGEASTGGMDGDKLPSPAGTRTGTIVTDGNVVWVKISDDQGNYVLTRYERGKKPVQTFGSDGKPRPDDAGSGPRPRLTDEEKRRLAEEMPRPVDLAGQPVDDGGDAPRGPVVTDPAEWLTDLVLAGQPVDDSSGGGRGAPPDEPVLTDLGLAGQPVGDDPDFGRITPGSGNGGFGSAVLRMKSAALALGGRRLPDAPTVDGLSREDLD